MIGRSPFDVNAIMHGLNESMYHSHYSQAAVGDALYDAVGKLLGVPVYQILGGKTRDKVRVAAVLSMKGTVESLLESADEFFEQGFRHLVLKIGVDPREDLRNAEALRKRFGDEIALRIDANAALDYDDALSLLTKLEPFDIETAEQPLNIWNVDGMADLAQKLRMPLMADECVATDHALMEIIAKRGELRPDESCEERRHLSYPAPLAHAECRAWALIQATIRPRASPQPLSHRCAALGPGLNDRRFCGWNQRLLAEDIVENPIRHENGEIPIPDGPGLGITLDEDALQKLRIDT